MKQASLILIAVEVMLCCTLAPAQQNAGAPAANAYVREEPQRPNPPLPVQDGRYAVRPGDVLDISFPFSPEFNQVVAVQPDGYISLKEASQMLVLGMSLPEVSAALRKAYAETLRDPVANVELKEFEKPYFLVTGEVRNPGKFELRGDTTVMQAVATAGGMTEAAKHSRVLLMRRSGNDWVEVKKLDLKQMMRGDALDADLHLRPGDMVFVPQNTFSKLKGFIVPRATIGPSVRTQ